MRDLLTKYKNTFSFLCLTAVALAVMYVLFDSATNAFPANGSQLILIGTESLFLSSFILLLRGRWRVVIPVLTWLAAAFFLSNLFYYRYWHDLLPLAQIFNKESYNSFVFGSVPSLLRPVDCVFIILPLGVSLAYRFLGISRQADISLKKGTAAVACVFILWIGAQALAAYASFRYWRSADCPTSFASEIKKRFVPERNSSRLAQWYSRELIFYLYHQACTSASMSAISLDDEAKAEIAQFVESIPRRSMAEDSVFALNKDKNLILIIVESLNADAIGNSISGLRITPTLDSLIESEGTVSCLKMIPQISDGSSSDGQFIYNTGLLPLRGDAVAMSFAGNSFPGLPFALGREEASAEVIFESADVWNHSRTSEAYGYGRLVDNLDADGRTMDESVFECGLSLMDSLPRPFLAELVSLSMHYPYNDPNVQTPLELRSDNRDMGLRYLASLHAFDKALAEFLNRLKSRGLYDDSVIFIVSDHDNEPSGEPIRHDIVFIAANTGATLKVERPVGQIDVYPTILEIMGHDTDWKGLGVSILDANNSSSVGADGTFFGASGKVVDSLKARAWDISELIIRGDWFATQPSLKTRR